MPGSMGAQERRKFHGRRHGKALTAAQRRRIAEMLPGIAVPGLEPEADPQRVPLDARALFGDDRALWLEIGFGSGEHLVRQARAHPQAGLIGCEPFVNGVAAALGAIEAAGTRNVRLHAGDARDLIEVLAEGALARVFLLYPDPWPKTRHRERRFMSRENLGALARVMAPGSELRLATDIPRYVDHALGEVAGQGGFAELPRDRPEAWADWEPTRYEVKARAAGRGPQYLSFRRL